MRQCLASGTPNCSTPRPFRTVSAGGEPVVTNGIAMCNIHQAASDGHLMAVRPDYAIELRRDALTEDDGPTLRYALQGHTAGRSCAHGDVLNVPTVTCSTSDTSSSWKRSDLSRPSLPH
jgi:hypothetical protein